jgi:hypothetical protein
MNTTTEQRKGELWLDALKQTRERMNPIYYASSTRGMGCPFCGSKAGHLSIETCPQFHPAVSSLYEKMLKTEAGRG